MKLENMTWKELLGTEHTIAERLFDGKTYPWEVLGGIGEFITTLGPLLPENEYRKLGKDIWIHKTARMAPGVAAAGPMIICAGAQVRQGAFLRGKVIIGERAVVGNSCELKNAVLFDEVQVPHFNYVGDSILGYKAHMGAGAVTSNVKSDKTLVKVHAEDGDGDRSQEIRSDPGRLRGGGLQQRAQPRYGDRKEFQHLPLIQRAGLRSGKLHLQG